MLVMHHGEVESREQAAMHYHELEKAVGEGRQDVSLHGLFGQQDLLGPQVLLGEMSDDQGAHGHLLGSHLLCLREVLCLLLSCSSCTQTDTACWKLWS